jgi:hypothetical protein
MDIIDAFIGWKRFWEAQTSVAQAKRAFVDGLVIRMEGKLGAYGGWANGMPRNRAVRPMQSPVKVALSRWVSGGAPPMLQNPNPLPTSGVICSCIAKGLNVVARARNAW